MSEIVIRTKSVYVCTLYNVHRHVSNEKDNNETLYPGNAMPYGNQCATFTNILLMCFSLCLFRICIYRYNRFIQNKCTCTGTGTGTGTGTWCIPL